MQKFFKYFLPNSNTPISRILHSPYFDAKYYRDTNSDLSGSATDLANHYHMHGWKEFRNPGRNFSSLGYMLTYADVAMSGVNPLLHYIEYGVSEGRVNGLQLEKLLLNDENFDAEWYLKSYPDVAAAGVNALFHYVQSGVVEGRNPSNHFHTSWYLQNYPDVKDANINPLAHYLLSGKQEGRLPLPPAESRMISDDYLQAGDLNASTLMSIENKKLGQLQAFFLPNNPINVFVDHRLNATPALNIVLPSTKIKHATGGPNTVYLLAMLLAASGVRIRLFSTDVPPDEDLTFIKGHLKKLSDVDPEDFDVEFVDVSDRALPKAIGGKDLFLATAWWTAQMVESVLSLTGGSRFYYMIQDYETLFYRASENFADTERTYSFEHFPIINSEFLCDNLAKKEIGKFSDPNFSKDALVFQPAVDRKFFFPEVEEGKRVKRLLFYARPTVAVRNLFGMGVAAIRAAIEQGLFDDDEWEFIGMGESFDSISLGNGHYLTAAPWHNFEDYAKLVRSSDIMLSLMLSPHPSYPPLEMAACGGPVVTSTYGTKSSSALRQLSPCIFGMDPSIDSLVEGIARAKLLPIDIESKKARATELNLPADWIESLQAVIPRVINELEKDGLNLTTELPALDAPSSFVHISPQIEGSPISYFQDLQRRSNESYLDDRSVMYSLITTVYDIDPDYLNDLANTVFGQINPPKFEWVILDNGTSNPGTLSMMERLAENPCVRLASVEKNLGIVGGMRWCLENAIGQYVLPLDSDDLLFPDALNCVAKAMKKAGYPKLGYTNEDKIDETGHRDPYYKPEWDPVLFVHSCFVAHLTVIDRNHALRLDCYGDKDTEGCHDWDSFTRFMVDEQTPLHIPELTYSWRMHAGSTSGNIESKPYVYASHTAVLSKFLNARSPGKYQVVESPIFRGSPDWRFDDVGEPVLSEFKVFLLNVSDVIYRDKLSAAIKDAKDATHIHFLSDECIDENELGCRDARILSDLFSDTVMVGGRIHDGNRLHTTGFVFGFDGGVGCPDKGRDLNDPGYFAQCWKPKSVGGVSARNAYVKMEFLNEIIDQLPENMSIDLLGPWLGALAHLSAKRVIYTPYIEGKQSSPALLTNSEKQVFNAEFGGDLWGVRTGYSQGLGMSRELAYTPDRSDSDLKLLGYSEFFEIDLAKRVYNTELQKFGNSNSSSISIITTVYANTNTNLFKLTAQSVSNQLLKPYEWIVLSHGPISNDLSDLLDNYEKEGLLKLLKQKDNLGIQGGLSVCLKEVGGSYALSLDADDILTKDAILQFQKIICNKPEVDVFYSDESLLINGTPQHPYYRPDFDPVLLCGQSYVWHSIVYKVKKAREIGVYSSRETEYAQDWDTLIRFFLHGASIALMPQVVCHWRQHEKSLSNSGSIYGGTISSVKGALGFIRENSTIKKDLSVQPYPRNLGAPDYYLEFCPKQKPSLSLISFGSFPQEHKNISCHSRNVISMPFASGGIKELLKLVRETKEDYLLLTGPGLGVIDNAGVLQAIKHLEIVPSCMAITGAIIDRIGMVQRSGGVHLPTGELIDEAVGQSIGKNGSFSIMSKAHCVSTVHVDLLVARRKFLLASLENCPEKLGLETLGIWLGAFALKRNELLAYEPLLVASADIKKPLVSETLPSHNPMLNALFLESLEAFEGSLPLRGISRFIYNMRRHS